MATYNKPMGSSTRSFCNICRQAVLISCFGFAATSVVNSAPLMAQQTAARVVDGKVVDGAGSGLKGATVFLKDGHTLSVRSYIAGDDGTYRFSQLSGSADYQIWAELDGKKSSVKNISSFNTGTEFHIMLKIDSK